jgi:hypothetical protein
VKSIFGPSVVESKKEILQRPGFHFVDSGKALNSQEALEDLHFIITTQDTSTLFNISLQQSTKSAI